MNSTGALNKPWTLRQLLRFPEFLAVTFGIAGGRVYCVRGIPQLGQHAAAAAAPRVPVAVADGFDPMVRFASVGWLPPDVVQRTTIVQSGATKWTDNPLP